MRGKSAVQSSFVFHEANELLLTCEYPGCDTHKVQPYPSCTAYADDGNGPDPNRMWVFCEIHGKEHLEHWDEMWASYNEGLL